MRDRYAVIYRTTKTGPWQAAYKLHVSKSAADKAAETMVASGRAVKAFSHWIDLED